LDKKYKCVCFIVHYKGLILICRILSFPVVTVYTMYYAKFETRQKTKHNLNMLATTSSYLFIIKTVRNAHLIQCRFLHIGSSAGLLPVQDTSWPAPGHTRLALCRSFRSFPEKRHIFYTIVFLMFNCAKSKALPNCLFWSRNGQKCFYKSMYMSDKRNVFLATAKLMTRNSCFNIGLYYIILYYIILYYIILYYIILYNIILYYIILISLSNACLVTCC